MDDNDIEKMAAIMHEAIEHYGVSLQTVVAMEEMAELIKELSKAIRGQNNVQAVVEEIADVQVMIWQLAMIYTEDPEYVHRIAMQKLNRLHQRIEQDLLCCMRNSR